MQITEHLWNNGRNVSKNSFAELSSVWKTIRLEEFIDAFIQITLQISFSKIIILEYSINCIYKSVYVFKNLEAIKKVGITQDTILEKQKVLKFSSKSQ